MIGRVFAISLLPLAVLAGVRGVGGGGGLAEMQTKAIDQNLVPLLQICAGGSCGLADSDRELLRTLLSEGTILNQPLLINTQCKDPFFHGSGGSLSVDACFLYQKEGDLFGARPKPAAELAEVVLSLRLAPITEWSIARDLAHRLSHDVRGQIQHHVFSIGERVYRLNIWRLQMAAQEWQLLGLEDVKASYDLTGSLREVLACEHPAWQIRDLTFQNSADQAQATGQIEWTCRDQRFRGILLLGLSFSGAVPKEVSTYIFNRQSW